MMRLKTDTTNSKRVTYVVLATVIILLIVGVFLLPDQVEAPNAQKLEKAKIEIITKSNKIFLNLEVADTQTERAIGLMYRSKSEVGEGMLFVFQSENQSGFWMKNTLVPLDMLFIDANGTIVEIFENVTPCKVSDCPSYTPKQSYRYVIELNSGKVKEYRIEVGDSVKLPN